MRNLAKKLMLNSSTWSLIGGLMLAGVLGACSKVYVAVDNNCSSAGTRIPIQEAGACNPPATIAQNTAATTLNAYDSVTRLKITDNTLMCLAGGLASTGGACQWNKPCRTWYHAISGTQTGNCTAGCDP